MSDNPSLREHLEVRAIAERAEDKADRAINAVEKAAAAIERFTEAAQKRHDENEASIQREERERRDSIARVYRTREEDQRASAVVKAEEEKAAAIVKKEEEKKLEERLRRIEDRKLMSKAWAAGVLFAGSAASVPLVFVAKWVWELCFHPGKPPVTP